MLDISVLIRAIYQSTAQPPDPFWTNVISLLRFDSNFGDSASGVWTGIGAPVISSSEKQFGAASLYLNGSSYLTRPSNTMSLFGSKFTIEFWLYKTVASDVGILFSVSGSGLTLETISGNLVIGKRNVVPVLATANAPLPINEWVHVAVVLDSPNTRLYQNGILVASVANTDFATGDFQLGAYTSVSKYFTGYIDDFRFTSGIARYTSNFAPPPQFPDF
jgi:hypothetical protein